MVNPYEAPNFEATLSDSEQPTVRQYSGLRRVPYVCVVMLVYLLPSLLIPVVSFGDDPLEIGVVIALIVVLLLATAFRCINIGISSLWSLGMFIPFFNLFILGRCLVAQTGYAQQQKLDRAGQVGLVVYVALIAIGVVAMFLGS